MLRDMQQAVSRKRKKRHFIAEWAKARSVTPSMLIAATEADKSNVSRWLKGSEPSSDYMERIAAFFDVPAAQLYAPPPRELIYTPDDPADPGPMAADQPMVVGEYSRLPKGSSPQLDVTAGMGAGGFTLVADGVPGVSGMTFGAEYVSGYWSLPPAILSAMAGARAKDVVFIPVQGDSMFPTLNEGDVVVVDTRHRWPSPDGIYALTDAFGGIVVKRLEVTSRPGDENPTVDVISDNPRHPRKTWPIEELRVVGRVVRKFGSVS